jgi:hypothetical protein
MAQKMSVFVVGFCCLLFILAGPAGAQTADPPTQGQSPAPEQPSNLTLWNFFTEGWDQQWTHRDTPGGAPDMALIHVTTNFLEREFRFDSYQQQNLSSDSNKATYFTDALVAYGINRRFMLEVVSNYEWKDPKASDNINGSGGALVGRFQLVDIPGSSYAFQVKVSSPNVGIGNQQTTFSPSIAGWQDLTGLGLKRVGLYYSLTEDTYAGPAAAGSKRNDLLYDVSLAKTWTEKTTPLFGNFTTFVELYSTTNLDGPSSDRGLSYSEVNVTPAFRFDLTHNNTLMGGIDFPVSSPHDFTKTFRLTYIYRFE